MKYFTVECLYKKVECKSHYSLIYIMFWKKITLILGSNIMFWIRLCDLCIEIRVTKVEYRCFVSLIISLCGLLKWWKALIYSLKSDTWVIRANDFPLEIPVSLQLDCRWASAVNLGRSSQQLIALWNGCNLLDCPLQSNCGYGQSHILKGKRKCRIQKEKGKSL